VSTAGRQSPAYIGVLLPLAVLLLLIWWMIH
jgi:hypothetical protein